MTKKFVLSSLVLALFLMAAMPSFAAMKAAGDVNLFGQWAGTWPDYNGVIDPNNTGWSVHGTADGKAPIVATVTDPNELPPYSQDSGGGTVRVAGNFMNGTAICQTFSTDGNTDGFTLTRIAIRASGEAPAYDGNGPFTVHLYDINATYGYVPSSTNYTPANDGIPYSGVLDFLSTNSFYSDPCLLKKVGTADADVLVTFDFNGVDNVELEPNHTYAVEIWGPTAWTAQPPYVFYWIWYGQANPYSVGCGYGVDGLTDNGSGPGPSNLTNTRGLSLGGADHDTVMAVYGNYVDGNAFHPAPRKGQTQISRNPTFTWHPGKWAKTHRVWFSSVFTFVANRAAPAYKGIFTDPCYTPTGTLALNTPYYWRVDEMNDTPTVTVPQPDPGNYYWGEPNNVVGDTTDRHTIWMFTTISPSASNPNPPSIAVPQQIIIKPEAPYIQWTPGALVQSTSGHQLYFGTSFADVNSATTATGLPIYRGAITDPCYSLKRLYSDYGLTSDTTYYWRVDEVNASTSPYLWKGPTWNFKMPNPATILIDDFSSSPTAFASRWKYNYSLPFHDEYDVNLNGTSSISASGGYLTIIYDDTSTNGSSGPWSEAKLDYNDTNVNGIDWTIGGTFVPKAIGVLFDGNMGNTIATDANRSKLYLGIEDATGNSGFVYYNTDIYAAQRAITIDSSNAGVREWKVALTDSNFSAVNMAKVSAVYLGIGSPRGSYTAGYGGQGAIKFDNIKVYVQHCNPTYPQTSMVAGDLEGPELGSMSGDHTRWTTPDCVVNYSDVYYLIQDWLFAEPNLVFDSNVNPGTANLEVEYKFDDGPGSTSIADTSGNNRNATLYNLNPFTWAYAGHNNTGYCVNLEPGYHSWIECPNSVVPGTGSGQTFTFWLKYNDRFQEEHLWASVLVFHSTGPGQGEAQTSETQLPDPFQNGQQAMPWLRWVDIRSSKECGLQKARASQISSRWNHYALVYDTTSHSMTMYLNGSSIASVVDTNVGKIDHLWGPNSTGDGNANTVRIGTRGNKGPSPLTAGNYDVNNNMFWQGRIDDMRLYSKALSVPEIQTLVADFTSKRNMQAVFVEPDNFSTGTVTNPSYFSGQPVQIINFNDFAGVASHWLNQQLWP